MPTTVTLSILKGYCHPSSDDSLLSHFVPAATSLLWFISTLNMTAGIPPKPWYTCQTTGQGSRLNQQISSFTPHFNPWPEGKDLEHGRSPCFLRTQDVTPAGGPAGTRVLLKCSVLIADREMELSSPAMSWKSKEKTFIFSAPVRFSLSVSPWMNVVLINTRGATDRRRIASAAGRLVASYV